MATFDPTEMAGAVPRYRFYLVTPAALPDHLGSTLPNRIRITNLTERLDTTMRYRGLHMGSGARRMPRVAEQWRPRQTLLEVPA